MNKRLYVLGGIFVSFLLAACGGGGSGPLPSASPTVKPTAKPTSTPTAKPTSTPTAKPTSSPAATYSAKLIFVGALSGRQIQGELRRSESRSLMDITSVPVMVVSAPESGLDASHFGGQIEAVVSPLPASSPTVSFANTNPDAVLAVPTAAPSPEPLPTGVIAEAIVSGSNAIQSQQSGTASATIGDPVDEVPTVPVYSYMSIALDTGSGGPGGVMGFGYTEHMGWKWANSTWSPDDDPNDADIYIDASGTINVPGGDVRITTDTPFNAVTASQWSNAETSFTLADAITENPDGSNNGLVIGKTRDGSSIFKLFPNTINQGVGYFGAIEVAGSSVDGF